MHQIQYLMIHTHEKFVVRAANTRVASHGTYCLDLLLKNLWGGCVWREKFLYIPAAEEIEVIWLFVQVMDRLLGCVVPKKRRSIFIGMDEVDRKLRIARNRKVIKG